jgi:hypothetical protein
MRWLGYELSSEGEASTNAELLESLQEEPAP